MSALQGTMMQRHAAAVREASAAAAQPMAVEEVSGTKRGVPDAAAAEQQQQQSRSVSTAAVAAAVASTDRQLVSVYKGDQLNTTNNVDDASVFPTLRATL